MMIPEIINEVERTEFDGGKSYMKQYVVYAPQWDLYRDVDGTCRSYDYASEKINHFVISESTRCGYLETLVFACDDQGKTETHMIEIMGGRDYTADEILVSFALHMMEAGYDTV